MKFLIAGATGQLGRHFVSQLGDDVAWAGGRAELDVRDAGAVSRLVRQVRPDVVVNAAAYNDVDAAETDVASCFAVNAAGPLHLARAAGDAGALIIHFSTDYVFDGRTDQPYTEADQPQPLNVFGAAKLAGEQLVVASGCPFLIVRTSGMFGSQKADTASFVEDVLARARTGELVRAVSDQVFTPTYAPDLVEAVVTLMLRGSRGLFHLTNSGSCTWYGLANTVLEYAGLKGHVEPVKGRDSGKPARRPSHSLLSKARYEGLGLAPLRPWSTALKEHLAP